MKNNFVFLFHLMCYIYTKVSYIERRMRENEKEYESEKENVESVHAAQSHFPEEHKLLSIRCSNAGSRRQGTLYTRDLTETVRRDPEQN